MAEAKKSDAEINAILKELRELEMYDFDTYEKKLEELKKSDSSTYFKIMILLNMSSDAIYCSTGAAQQLPSLPKANIPVSKPLPENLIIKPKEAAAAKAQTPIKPPAKREAEKKSNPAAFAIVSMAVIGILLLAVVGFFWIMNPPSGDTSRNSLRYGYQLFNGLNETYLNYTFLYNSSAEEFIGKQYYYLDESRITAVLQNGDKSIVSKKQNNYLYYDLMGNYSKTDIDSLRMNNALILSLYYEVYNLVNNYYTNESGREEVWNLTSIACAPLFFEIDVDNAMFSDVEQLRYEMCLNEDGIPIAIAKETMYPDSYEIIIAYLESMNPEIGDLVFGNKTLALWKEFVIDDY